MLGSVWKRWMMDWRSLCGTLPSKQTLLMEAWPSASSTMSRERRKVEKTMLWDRAVELVSHSEYQDLERHSPLYPWRYCLKIGHQCPDL